MAGRMLVMTNDDAQIKGNCQAAGYENYLILGFATLGSSASISAQEITGDVYQSSVTVSVETGPWIAELEQALFSGKNLGNVTISELAQVTDAANNKTWKKVREIKLTNGWLESISVDWSGINTSTQLSLQYTDSTFTWGDKVAHFNRSEKTT